MARTVADDSFDPQVNPGKIEFKIEAPAESAAGVQVASFDGALKKSGK
jgi:hypothetical protein